MSVLLRDELARNEYRRKLVDPRTVPLRFHNLKAIGRSAAHCFESFQATGDSTLAQRLGSGVHAILMGQPVKVWNQPSEASLKRREKAKLAGAPLPPITAAPRSGKEWDKFERDNPSCTILTQTEFDESVRMATAIRNNPEAQAWLDAPGVAYEQTILWSQGGIDRRSTPDLRCPRRITEVKTTRSAAPGQFRWDVKRFCYHAQLVDQRNAARAKFGAAPDELCIIAVEKTRPYVTQTYRLTPRDIELGEQILGAWFNAYRVALDSDAWGGYADGTIDLDVPDDSDDGEITFGVEDEGEANETDDTAESPF